MCKFADDEIVCSSDHNDVADVGEYKLGKTLGDGRYGIVKEATKASTGERFAIKIIHAAKIDEVKLAQEIQNHQVLHHKHVIGFVEILRKDGDAYIVLELASGDDLFALIERNVLMPEKTVRCLFQQIIAGLEHCHENKIVHRDMKPENIFFDGAQNIKVGDFGLSAVIEEGKLLTGSYGTQEYAAPELFTRKCKYGTEVDIWSCGIILYNLLTCQMPKLVGQGRIVLPRHVSSEATDLIHKMLTRNPSQRISISDIKKHPWFKKDLPTDLFPGCAGFQDQEELKKEANEMHLQKVPRRLDNLSMTASLPTACSSGIAKIAESVSNSLHCCFHALY